MTTEAGTEEAIQQVNAKALIYTCSHTITVDGCIFYEPVTGRAGKGMETKFNVKK